MGNKIIFWDLDGTLGFFEHLALGKLSYSDPDCMINPFGSKEGIEELLHETASDGFSHYVTTKASYNYAIKALKYTDIKKYFVKVFAKEEICKPFGLGLKNYTIALNNIGIKVEEAKSNVLIIGNSIKDAPNKDYGIVSIVDKHQWIRNSELTKKMIYLLIDNGNNDFHKGFNELYTNSKKIIRLENNKISRYKQMIIEGDAELYLKFIDEKLNNSGSPVFQVIKADNYYRKTIEAQK